MPNGEANITNNVLEMLHADRHTVGHYKCTADNRVGQTDTRDVSVNVLCKYYIASQCLSGHNRNNRPAGVTMRSQSVEPCLFDRRRRRLWRRKVPCRRNVWSQCVTIIFVSFRCVFVRSRRPRSNIYRCARDRSGTAVRSHRRWTRNPTGVHCARRAAAARDLVQGQHPAGRHRAALTTGWFWFYAMLLLVSFRRLRGERWAPFFLLTCVDVFFCLLDVYPSSSLLVFCVLATRFCRSYDKLECMTAIYIRYGFGLGSSER